MIGDLDFCCYGDKNFLLHHHTLAKSWAHPVTYPADTGGLFQWGECRWIVHQTTHLSWVLRLMYQLCYVLMACCMIG